MVVARVLRGNMQVGDLVLITSNDKQLKMVGVYMGRPYHCQFSYKLMYEGGKVADFDIRFWKIEVLS